MHTLVSSKGQLVLPAALRQLEMKGLAMPVKDSLVTASALAHGLTVATRNTRNFRNAGVTVDDRFKC